VSATSTSDLLVLHAVRVLGHATTRAVSTRAGLEGDVVGEILLDAEAVGQVVRTRFADEGGWSLTETGKAHGERLLAAELDATGTRHLVREELDAFGPLNDLVAGACTRWQLTELGLADPPASVGQVLTDLTRAANDLAGVQARLTAGLARFGGYHERFAAAVERARHDTSWISATDRDSAHRVWFELHEDLLATLGRQR
jgi:hypothetical protein